PAERRLSLTIDLAPPEWEEYTLADKGLTVGLAASIVIAGGALAYFVVTPRPGERFTEFYLLGPGGNSTDYPSSLTVNQTGIVILGIMNHEGATVTYKIRIDLVGVRILYNTTAAFNDTVEQNRTTGSTVNVTLADGQNWTRLYTFQINITSLWKYQFLFFKYADFSSAYRELHLY